MTDSKKLEFNKKLLGNSNIFISENLEIPVPDNSIFYLITDTVLIKKLKLTKFYNLPVLVRFSDRQVTFSGNRFDDGGLSRDMVGRTYDYGNYHDEGSIRDIQIYNADDQNGSKYIPVQVGYKTNNLGRYEVYDFKNMEMMPGLPGYYDVWDILNHLGNFADKIADNKIDSTEKK